MRLKLELQFDGPGDGGVTKACTAFLNPEEIEGKPLSSVLTRTYLLLKKDMKEYLAQVNR